MAGAAHAQESDTIPLPYDCDFGARLVLAHDRGADLVYGTILDRPVLMDRAISGSGARYLERDAANRAGRFKLWMKGDAATLGWISTDKTSTPLLSCTLPTDSR